METLKLESKSISDLSSVIDSNFCDIIKILKESPGKIILTGIGKSAIIGMKISATLNSTGSKSIFVHLADALHGDMGVINKDDIVICISKSGESDEIKSLSNYLTKNNIILIGISCVKNSSLDNLSKMFIHTKIDREACHNNLAPTTSSTCHLAIGDAIAMTLQKVKGFTPLDFSKYHPSGNLGKKLTLTLNDLIDNNRKPLVEKSSSFLKIIDEISSNMYGATAVVEDNVIIGVVTDGDIRRVIEKKQKIENISASDFMNKNPKIMTENTLAVEALIHMKENRISQVLITNNSNVYLGIVHILDIIKEGINNE
ncbi:KpsF/GutQ family sugar-phosphate isomerase [Flavobacteriaceae bacterium]|nr:KpsF/GutQ family sugar-phosphate isomerase [Flavobacteriaceae bacterium]MDC0923283.1 KpsF/GutQ family sugar-phosphate isomerase [Flavobacteriaceae bacterium]